MRMDKKDKKMIWIVDMIDGDMFALEKTGSEIVDLIALNVLGIKLINPKHKGC